MKCKKGDLAVVVSAVHQMNIGRIVHVIKLHDGKGPLSMKNAGPVWLVSCSHQMKWTSSTKVYRRKIGPVPDYRLQPIRGIGLDCVASKKSALRSLKSETQSIKQCEVT